MAPARWLGSVSISSVASSASDEAASRFWACADGTARPRVIDNAAITIERMIPSYRPTTLLPQKGQPVRRRVKIPPVPGVFYRQRPGWTFPRAVRGEGAFVWDETGRRLIDAAGGAIVVGIGHGVREVADAIGDQARQLAYVHGTELTSEPVEQLAAALATRVPVDRSEEHTSELQSHSDLVCRLLLEKKKKHKQTR